MNARVLTTTGLVLAIVLLFAVNILTAAAFGWVRLDLTENGLYTLSQGTRNVLSKLEEPITLRFYLSEQQLSKVPALAGYATRVKTLLQEYERLSDGKITVHVIDPEPFSEQEDRAVGYGLRAVPIGSEEESLYFGLVGTNSTDDQEVIPFLSTEREEFLEYDVTKLVHGLTDPKRTVVGLISTLPIEGAGPAMPMGAGGANQWMVVDQMRQLFDVRSLNTHLEAVPDDIDVLMLVHPQDLNDRAQYAIDQFVLRGGRAVVFVDPYSESQPQQRAAGLMMMPRSRRSELDRLLEAWGVALEKDKVVADLSLAVTVRMQRGGRVLTFEYPVWMNVQPQYMDGDDIVTGDLGNLAFGTAGSLVAVDGATTRMTPLVRTTENATTFTPSRIDLAASDPQALLREYEPQHRSYVLAARVSGKARTAFPDGQPPLEAKDGENASASTPGVSPAPAHLAESAEDVNLLIVSDTDLLSDRFWVVVQDFLGSKIAVPSAANGALVVNAIDNLSGSSDLISVRNRGSFVRPFEKVNDLRQQAELRFREKERELMARLDETEKKLVELEQAKGSDEGVILSDEQREELIRFRQEKLRIRKELREVRHELRRSIESLEAGLKFANIGLVPLLIGLGGVAAAFVRARRRRSSIRSAGRAG